MYTAVTGFSPFIVVARSPRGGSASEERHLADHTSGLGAPFLRLTHVQRARVWVILHIQSNIFKTLEACVDLC